MYFFLCILFVFISLGLILSLRVSNPGRTTPESALLSEAEKGIIDPDYWNGLRKEFFEIASRYGYPIKGVRVFSDAGAAENSGNRVKRVLVACHGHGYNYAGSIKYIGYFLDAGFDAVLYDHRNCGRSGGTTTTMGYFEKDDLSRVIDHFRGVYGSATSVGTLGESMGAATVILQAAMSDPPDFVIADCSFSDLSRELAYRLKVENHLPPFPVLHLASLCTKLFAGYYYGQVSPLRAIQKHDGLPSVPILFMHGGSDTYILPDMSRELFEAKKGLKGFTIIPEAGHVEGIVVNRALYLQSVGEFLKKVYT